jgi:hypothetical protein
METQPVAYSVLEFCKAYRICRGLLYRLWREGAGPKMMKIGKRTVISREAAQEWRQKLEAEQEGR